MAVDREVLFQQLLVSPCQGAAADAEPMEGTAKDALHLGHVVDSSLQQLAKVTFITFIIAWVFTCKSLAQHC